MSSLHVSHAFVFDNSVTRALERAQKNSECMKDCSKYFEDRLVETIAMVAESKTNPYQKIKLGALLVSDVHNRDVVANLLSHSVSSVNSFLWKRQMRHYWSGDCTLEIGDVSHGYQYEYVGNTSRLVITPSTDRCFVTLFQALRLNLGVALVGPAGTGKTETVKDLARSLAVCCYTYNCSDQMDHMALGQMFKGLAQSGP